MTSKRPDIAYIPTPQIAVDMLLSLAAVTADDVVYDLGCGDGRVLITAAQRFGARGVGIDIDPNCLNRARSQAKQQGLCDRIQFIHHDLFTADLHQATVVALYLLPHLNLRLRPHLLAQLRPGTRLVSHQFDMGDWQPDQVIRLPQTEEESTLYRWIVPE
jgi:cyclopropane fatty-acyl-phospholipid synthase-like methyltransferase